MVWFLTLIVKIIEQKVDEQNVNNSLDMLLIFLRLKRYKLVKSNIFTKSLMESNNMLNMGETKNVIIPITL